MTKMNDNMRYELSDKCINELVEYAHEHGFNVGWEPFSNVAFDYVYGHIDNTEDYNFDDLLALAKKSGVFDTLKPYEFDKYITEPYEVLAMDKNGKIGIFYDGSYNFCGDGYHKISREDIPLNWFDNYQIFSEMDI